MKLKFTTVFIGVLALFINGQIYAAEHHTAQALEHSALATAHGQDGHAEQLLRHAEAALIHAQAAEKEHAETAMAHMRESIGQ